MHKKDPTLPCQYIGQTSHTLRERFGEHRRGIQNNTDESVPIHFNQPKHTLNDIQLIPILHINNNRDSIRLSMEQHLIEKAGALQNRELLASRGGVRTHLECSPCASRPTCTRASSINTIHLYKDNLSS